MIMKFIVLMNIMSGKTLCYQTLMLNSLKAEFLKSLVQAPQLYNYFHA